MDKTPHETQARIYANLLERFESFEARWNEFETKQFKDNLLAEIERTKADGFTFSDKQDKRIREIIHDEGFIQVGKITLRGVLLALGTLASVCFGAILAYLGFKR